MSSSNPFPSSRSYDVVIVGAGIAGANVAQQLGERGLSVAIVERRAFGSAGAHWNNGVLDWQFVRAGLEPPVSPERSPAVARVHMFAADGTRGVSLANPPTVSANMTLLGERLRRGALNAGAQIFDETSTIRSRFDGARLVSLEISRRSGETARLEAPLFIDASGMRGILRRSSPKLMEWCPTVRGDEICSASDFRFAVADHDGALRFLERHGASPGETISTLGVSGGFSTRGVTIASDLETVSILVGCLANGRYGTGPRMLNELTSAERWIGAPLHGGSGVIPLRRPFARFTAPGLALVGDSACQVFPAHGSGIGLGLIAGRILVDTITSTDTPQPQGSMPDIGDEAVLWRYQSSFMDEFGATLISSESVRRMSTALGTNGVTALMRTGVMSESMLRAGLNQELVTPPPSEMLTMASRLAPEPLLAMRVLPILARGRIASSIAGSYPSELDVDALRRWDRRVQKSLGPLPR